MGDEKSMANNMEELVIQIKADVQDAKKGMESVKISASEIGIEGKRSFEELSDHVKSNVNKIETSFNGFSEKGKEDFNKISTEAKESMGEVKKSIDKISGEGGSFTKVSGEAKESFNEIKKSASDVGSEGKKSFDGLASSLKGGLVLAATAAMTAIAGIGISIKSSVDAINELDKGKGKIQAMTGVSEDAAKRISDAIHFIKYRLILRT